MLSTFSELSWFIGESGKMFYAGEMSGSRARATGGRESHLVIVS